MRVLVVEDDEVLREAVEAGLAQTKAGESLALSRREFTILQALMEHPEVAPRVLKEGTAYLRSKDYEVLSDFGPAPKVLDPAKVDWKAVVEGRTEAFVRQKPGPTSGLGKIVFKFPNEMGIYLHDTPGKALFKQDDRLASAGCVRLEDADGLSKHPRKCPRSKGD